MNQVEYLDMKNKELKLKYICYLFMNNPKLVYQNIKNVEKILEEYEKYMLEHDEFNSSLLTYTKGLIFGKVI